MDITIYAGNAGDRNERGMRGAVELGAAIAALYRRQAWTVGEAVQPAEGGWAEQLRAATPNLQQLSRHIAARLEAVGGRTVLTMGRCAASLATLPRIARRFPDAAVIWFDAHGDCNVPIDDGTSDMGYLGGMVLTGAAGEWETGLGGGLSLANVILVGARDLDPPEQSRIHAGQIQLVPVGDELGTRLTAAIGGRQVYVHLDCDVLEPGLLATEYQVSGGLDWSMLGEAFEVLAAHDPVGFEIAEYEAAWPNGEPSDVSPLLRAIRPVLTALQA